MVSKRYSILSLALAPLTTSIFQRDILSKIIYLKPQLPFGPSQAITNGLSVELLYTSEYYDRAMLLSIQVINGEYYSAAQEFYPYLDFLGVPHTGSFGDFLQNYISVRKLIGT